MDLGAQDRAHRDAAGVHSGLQTANTTSSDGEATAGTGSYARDGQRGRGCSRLSSPGGQQLVGAAFTLSQFGRKRGAVSFGSSTYGGGGGSGTIYLAEKRGSSYLAIAT